MRSACQTDRAAPEARWVKGILDNLRRAMSTRGQTVKQGHDAQRHSTAAWNHFHQRSDVAATLSRVKEAAVLCTPSPEQVCELWEIFMTGRRYLIKCGWHLSVPWVV